MFDKLAEDLSKARIKNNLTLQQLSAKTRIDIKFLEAMEEGNFSFLPELYVKAFIKEYADVVGMNGELTLKKYEAAKEGNPFEEVIENKEDEENTESGNAIEKNIEEKQIDEVKHSVHQPGKTLAQAASIFDSTSHPPGDVKKGNKNNYLIGAVIGGIIVVFGLIYLVFIRGGNEIIVTEKPYDEVVSESRQRYEEKPGTKADSLQDNPVSSDSLKLLIQTTDTSWVRIILDNFNEEEFILFPNSQKSFTAGNNFKITFGKSAAIKLQLNNKPLAFNPKLKTVSYVMISSKGLEYLQSPPAKGNE